MRNDGRRSVLVVTLAAALVSLPGCGPGKEVRQAPPAPGPAFTGPDYLRSSIGSMSKINGYRPRFVSGYGLVVGLDGTGSPEVPPALRAWLMNEMASRGVGRESTGGELGQISPAQLLASRGTAVVLVEGVIPPGAVKGSTFDITIAALPQTQTTSLEGGRLYTTDLRRGGAIVGRPASAPMAVGRGDVFINPFVDTPGDDPTARPDDPRVGRILGGGAVTVNPKLGIVLNQPSYQRSRLIADRINGRFPQAPIDREPMAVAKSDQFIALNVLTRFRDNPKRMLELIGALFINPTERFTRDKARELLTVVEQDPAQAQRVAVAWEAMGALVLPILREQYDHSNPTVAITALEAGARLGDLRAVEPLDAIASGDTARADTAAYLLGILAMQHPEHFQLGLTLRNLIDHDDALVRFAAFDALAKIEDPAVKRRRFDDRLELALVRSSKPMIYVTQEGGPRIVIFDQMLGFNRPMLFSHNDSQLMLRLNEDDPLLAVYYKKNGQARGHQTTIAPAAGNLVYLLARRPTQADPSLGFEMGYSEIVRVLYELTEQGHVDAPLVLQPTDLARRIAQQRTGEPGPGDTGTEQRPETGPEENRPDNIVPMPGIGDN